jgi:hypothetical protein
MARTSKTASAAGIDHNAQYIKQLEDKLAMYESADADESSENYSVSQTDYIKVMNLLNYQLNLCTREYGQGKIYKFEKLYQIKKIIYSDLVDIIEVNSRFLEEGKFIILNPKVVRLHGLDETYSKILTKEKIEKILEGTDEGIALYSTANKGQQEVIVGLLVDKLIKDPTSLDMNMIDKLSRLSGVKIAEKAETARQLLASIQEESKQ